MTPLAIVLLVVYFLVGLAWGIYVQKCKRDNVGYLVVGTCVFDLLMCTLFGAICLCFALIVYGMDVIRYTWEMKVFKKRP